MSKQKNYFGHQHNWFTGTKLIKIFATMKSIKFSITICINFVGKMLIWDHFCDIMELSLNKYMGHFLIIFLFIESAIKPRPLLHANIQILLRTECNWSNWWWPECFYEPESSSHHSQRVASQSFQSTIYTSPMGRCASMLG